MLAVDANEHPRPPLRDVVAQVHVADLAAVLPDVADRERRVVAFDLPPFLLRLAVRGIVDVHDVAVVDEPDARLRFRAEDEQAILRLLGGVLRLVLRRAAVELAQVGRARSRGGEARGDEQHRGDDEVGETHGSLPSYEDRIPETLTPLSRAPTSASTGRVRHVTFVT